MLLGIESAKHGDVFQMFESNSLHKGRLNFKEHFRAGKRSDILYSLARHNIDL